MTAGVRNLKYSAALSHISSQLSAVITALPSWGSEVKEISPGAKSSALM